MTKDEDVAAGRRAAAVLRSIARLPANCNGARPLIALWLIKAGFLVEQEVTVKSYSKSGRGRINLLAFYRGGKVAIELDRRSPRRKSLYKLRQLDAYRLLALWNETCPTPAGIDEVVALDMVV